MVQRVTSRRNKTFKTKSNRRKIIKTPGGRLKYQYTNKLGKPPVCGECKKPLRGVKAGRPNELANMCKRKKHVSRMYGGCLCGKCVKSKILRAFLLEEQAVVKNILKMQMNR